MPEPEKLFYTIGEVSELLEVKPYVLRYWESEFKKLNPQKSLTGQRTYRRKDIQVAKAIKRLLYEEKYTIAGAVKKLNELEEKGELGSGDVPVSADAGPSQVEAPAGVVPAAQARPEKSKEFQSLLESSYAILRKHDLA